MAAIIQPAPQAQTVRRRTWWRWAVVLIPGMLIFFFFRLPGLNQEQTRLFGIFLATIIALVAQPVRMGVSVVPSP